MNLPDKTNWSTGDRTVFAHTKPTEPESRRNLDKLQKAQEFNWETPTLIYLLEESPAPDKDRRLHFPPSGPFLLPKKLPKGTNQAFSPVWDHSLQGSPAVTSSFINHLFVFHGECFYHAGNYDFPLVPASRTEINKELRWSCEFYLINLVRYRREEPVGHRLALYLGLGNASDQLQDGAFMHHRSTHHRVSIQARTRQRAGTRETCTHACRTVKGGGSSKLGSIIFNCTKRKDS